MSSSVLARTSEDKDLGVLISDSFKMSHQYGQAVEKVSQMLGYIARGVTSRKGEIMIPLFRALVRLHLDYCFQYWRPHLQKYIDDDKKSYKIGLTNKTY